MAEASRRRKKFKSSAITLPIIPPSTDLANRPNTNDHLIREADRSVPSTSVDEHLNATTSNAQAQIPLQADPIDPDDIVLAEVRRLNRAKLFQQQYSAQERGRCRKRMRNEESWKKNIIKSKRYSGQQYTSEKGKEFSARRIRSPCSVSCPRKCTTSFIETDRTAMFDRFWAMGNKKDQSTFVSTAVEISAIKRASTEKKMNRDSSFKYFFWKGETKTQVCRKFFLNTLDLKKDYVMGTVRRKDEFGMLRDVQSGKHENRANKCSAQVINSIKKHIESFPTIDSHYCRKDTVKRYLDESLSVNEMYRLYQKKCAEDGMEEVASKDKYRRVFTEQYNLAFFRPKKDLCDECVAFKNTANLSEEEIARNTLHIENKETARKLKNEAKERSIANQADAACCFDMQQLLPCPKSNSSSFFYKRKLYVHNLTVYDLGTSNVTCFMWPEFEAKRGANEVATCLSKYIERKVESGCKTIAMFADNCPGQNRNQFMAFMLTFMNKRHSLDKLVLTFLEKGHTETENDSVHSVIERATRNMEIFTPDQWYATVRGARKSKTPYNVKEMAVSEFMDFKEMAKAVKNMSTDDDGEKVKWSLVKQFIVYGGNKNALYVTYSYNGQEKCIDVSSRRRSSAGQRQAAGEQDDRELSVVYLQRACGITKVKKNDLLSLCHTRLVPPSYHSFYQSLPVGMMMTTTKQSLCTNWFRCCLDYNVNFGIDVSRNLIKQSFCFFFFFFVMVDLYKSSTYFIVHLCFVLNLMES